MTFARISPTRGCVTCMSLSTVSGQSGCSMVWKQKWEKREEEGWGGGKDSKRTMGKDKFKDKESN